VTGSRHARHEAPRSRRGLVVGAGIGALVLLAALFAGGLLVGRATSSPASSPAAAPARDGTAASPAPGSAIAAPAAATGALPSRPTMLADVTRVVTGDQIVVRVGATEIPVRVLGIDTPDPAATAGGAGQCGSREALEYAGRRLSGQTVTLVPDPTQPEFDDQGHRLSYVVLHSQLSYTDAVLMDGIGRADTSRPLWYAPVFAQEQGRAAAARVGIWGAPCEARP
jgi:endonuclease YncB( thermonuclease family)